MQTSRSFNGCENEVQTAGTIWLNRWQILLQNSTAFNTWIHLKSSFQPKCDALPLPVVQRNRRTVQGQAWHEELQQSWMIIAFWHSFDIILTLPAIAVSAALHPLGLGFFGLFSLHMDQGRKMWFCTAGMQPMVVENGNFHHGEKLSCKDACIKTGFSWKCQKPSNVQSVNWLID